MEIQISFPFLLAFLCFLLMIYKLSKSFKKSTRLPPGPWKLPLIGNLHQIGSLPHRSFRDFADKHGPIMHLQLGQLSHIVLSSPEAAREVMKTHDQIFANRPKIIVSELFCYNSTDIAFSPYGNYWRQLRKICNSELLTANRVQSFRKIREEEVSALVRSISEHEGSVVNLTKKIFLYTNSVVARAAFGKKTENVEEALSTMMQVIKLASGLSIFDLFPSLGILQVVTGTKARFEKLFKELDRILEDVINDHKQKAVEGGQEEEEEEDLVDVLLRVQKDNSLLDIPITLDNIKAVILNIFAGGTETAATTLEWAMSELVRNPEVMKKAQEEVRRVYGGKGYVDESELHQLKYVTAIIKETMRLYPPVVLLLPRENSESCEIYGYEIPRKTKVVINAWAIGRHPRYWDEPDKFQPERFLGSSVDFKGTNFEFIPFGAGRRICPGISFATPVLQLVIANLLYHFDWKLPTGIKHEEVDMSESFGATLRRKNDLCLVPLCFYP